MVKSQSPLISVIICTYNTKDITLQCLSKLKRSIDFLDKSVEVIVVENGTDGTGNLIKNKYPWVKLLEPKENTGFARGNNLGIKRANKKSKYYLLLNTDAYIFPETLKKSLEFMQNNSDCDLMGCRLLFEDGKLQPSAGFLPTPISVVTWALGIDLIPYLNRLLKPFHPNYPEFFKVDRRVGWVTGAFWFFKSEVIQKTHGFDENYFMYGEEIEWCKRIQDQGFKIWYTPQFEVVHLFSKSSDSTRNAFLREIEGIYYYMKTYYPHAIFVKAFVKLGMFARAILFTLLNNKYRANIHWDALKI